MLRIYNIFLSYFLNSKETHLPCKQCRTSSTLHWSPLPEPPVSGSSNAVPYPQCEVDVALTESLHPSSSVAVSSSAEKEDNVSFQYFCLTVGHKFDCITVSCYCMYVFEKLWNRWLNILCWLFYRNFNLINFNGKATAPIFTLLPNA